MGEVVMDISGVTSKISPLFNNRKFSDVTFLFIQDQEMIERMYGHKLILALRSEVFAFMFYDNKESTTEVKLPSSKKSMFSLLLKFLYTDVVEFDSCQEAQELYDMANEYAVEELIKKCSDFISCEKLTIENIMSRYEYALEKNITMLLKDCRDFVCSNTELVLESDQFSEAPVNVVEDVIKLDNLSVSTEIEVIRAVLKWGSEEMKRLKISPDEKYLRKFIDPFMKHLRFLTLSDNEFEYFLKNFNIFSVYEASLLTRKIYIPQCNIDFPEELCCIDVKRAKKHDQNKVLSASSTKNLSEDSVPSHASSHPVETSFFLK